VGYNLSGSGSRLLCWTIQIHKSLDTNSVAGTAYPPGAPALIPSF